MQVTQRHAGDGSVASAQTFTTPDRSRDPIDLIDAFATRRRYRRGQEIYGRGEPTGTWYRVVSGMARQCASFSDGRRQILAFLLPGDFFGFAVADQHHFSVEAVVEGTVIARYPGDRVEALVAANPGLGERIRRMAFESMARMQARMLSLGRMTARERVVSFLVEMAGRSGAGAAEEVVLHMSRYDVADYLALSVETVSRTLTSLRQRGAITLANTHQVRISDREALAERIHGS
jgi:CRP-like cAMP-binding protein